MEPAAAFRRFAPWVAVVALAGALSCADAVETWTPLDSIEQLKTAFNEDQGSTRIVLLLSPT